MLSGTPSIRPGSGRQVFRSPEGKPAASISSLQEGWRVPIRPGRYLLSSPGSRCSRRCALVLDRPARGVRQDSGLTLDEDLHPLSGSAQFSQFFEFHRAAELAELREAATRGGVTISGVRGKAPPPGMTVAPPFPAFAPTAPTSAPSDLLSSGERVTFAHTGAALPREDRCLPARYRPSPQEGPASPGLGASAFELAEDQIELPGPHKANRHAFLLGVETQGGVDHT